MENTTLLEDIVKRLSNIFQRNPSYEQPPKTDSSIETRRAWGGDVDVAGGGMFGWYSDETSVETKRLKKYKEYERMDMEAVEIASALDIYADNATSGDRDENSSIQIISDSDKVISIITETKKRLNLDFELWSIAREMVKYGDCFEEIVAYKDGEIHRLKHLPPSDVKVIEDKWGRLDADYPYEQTTEAGETSAKFRSWQIVHFRISKSRESRYGVDGSLLYPLRKVYKQLSMIEDSLVISRLTRAQQRFAFMVDVNGVEPGEATVDYLKQVKDMMKKKRTIDPVTGKMDLKYNPLSVEEDIFIARREGSGADVKVLQGALNLSQLQDVEYFSKKLFAGLKVPKAWMGFEGDTRARAVITELDVQFAKTVRRIQQALIEGLTKVFDLALLSRGINPAATPYRIQLPVMSIIDEMRAWQMETIKTQVAVSYAKDLNIGSEWIYRNLLNLSDEQIKAIRDELGDKDSIDNARLRQDMEVATQQAMIGAQAKAAAQTASGIKSVQPPPQAKGPSTAAQGRNANELPKNPIAKNEGIPQRDIRKIQSKLRAELGDLYETLNWEYEAKTGQSLDDLK